MHYPTGNTAVLTVSGEVDDANVERLCADDTLDNALATMSRFQVRQLPVIDQGRLVGMISVADIARALPNSQVGDLVELLSAP
ncbi:CBS domain-containing protein [Salinifilum ghardaiensis]